MLKVGLPLGYAWLCLNLIAQRKFVSSKLLGSHHNNFAFFFSH